jgi:hypothetical protein
MYLAQGGFAAANARFLTGFEDYAGNEAGQSQAGESDPMAFGPTPTAQEVTGKPARTFVDWARDHARDFV